MKIKIVYVDYLKVIGLLMIFIAHVCNNYYILQLRNFDVPLMVMVSGLLALNSYTNKTKNKEKAIKYYLKRFIRLVIPTWIFLVIYFVLIKIYFINESYPYDTTTILRSFLLLDGIGYVWIIRIYLMCSLLTPLIIGINEKFSQKNIKFILILIIYIIYELMVYFNAIDSNRIIAYFVLYIIPYGIIYYLGMLVKDSTSKSDLIVSLFYFILFGISFLIVYKIYGRIQLTQIMKYPPRIYYLSYALFVSYILFAFFKKINIKENAIIGFISMHSLWIYLWHIFVIKIINYFYNDLFWIYKLVIIVVCSILITFIQSMIVNFLEKNKYMNKQILNLFKG